MADPCARGGYFEVYKTGRKERKGSIVHAMEVRVVNAWRIFSLRPWHLSLSWECWRGAMWR